MTLRAQMTDTDNHQPFVGRNRQIICQVSHIFVVKKNTNSYALCSITHLCYIEFSLQLEERAIVAVNFN